LARGALSFKQRDITRAVRAIEAAGKRVQRLEIDREGKIVVVLVTGEAQEPAEEIKKGSEWDRI